MRNALRSLAYRLTTTREQRQDDALVTLDLMASGRLPAFRTYGDVLALAAPFPAALPVMQFALECGSLEFASPAALAAFLRLHA